MPKGLRNKIFIVLGVMVAAIYFIFPIQKRINLGLDLQGGMHLIVQVETDKVDAKFREDAVVRAIEILRNRIDSLGVGETLIQREGVNKVLIQLPGVTNREAALEMVGRVAHLEFRLVSSDPDKLKQALGGNVPDGYELKSGKKEKCRTIVH